MKILVKRNVTAVVLAFSAATAFAAGELDEAVLHGETDKERAIEYAPDEKMVFTLSLQGAKPFGEGEYYLDWVRSGDDGKTAKGREPLVYGKSFVYETALSKPGFVRLFAQVSDKDGKTYIREKPVGKQLKTVAFDGGAGVQPEKLKGVPEPTDFDAYWHELRRRLEVVSIRAERKRLPDRGNVAVYAMSIDCAGPRPVTGYLTMPKDAGKSKRYPARLTTEGYGYNPPHNPPIWVNGNEIVLGINAHGMKLPAFGADNAYYAALGEDIKSNGKAYAFDIVQNANRDTAYFNGMVLRVMRALQYLKTLPEWDGKNLYASGGSQGGLQTIWAAGCGEGVTLAESGITWCCDMGGTGFGRNRGSWFVRWTPALGYYDPINVARRIPNTCKVVVTRAGLGDYTCPPSGLAILWNNLTCPKKIRWVQGSTHGYVPTERHQEFVIEEDAREQ